MLMAGRGRPCLAKQSSSSGRRQSSGGRKRRGGAPAQRRRWTASGGAGGGAARLRGAAAALMVRPAMMERLSKNECGFLATPFCRTLTVSIRVLLSMAPICWLQANMWRTRLAHSACSRHSAHRRSVRDAVDQERVEAWVWSFGCLLRQRGARRVRCMSSQLRELLENPAVCKRSPQCSAAVCPETAAAFSWSKLCNGFQPERLSSCLATACGESRQRLQRAAAAQRRRSPGVALALWRCSLLI